MDDRKIYVVSVLTDETALPELFGFKNKEEAYSVFKAYLIDYLTTEYGSAEKYFNEISEYENSVEEAANMGLFVDDHRSISVHTVMAH